MGSMFGIISIPVGLIISMFVGVGLESLAAKLSLDVWNFSFYTCFSILAFSLLTYFISMKTMRNEDRQDVALILFFLVNLCFLNACLFYHVYEDRTDGQIAMGLLDFPLKTALVYPIFGLFHDHLGPFMIEFNKK